MNLTGETPRTGATGCYLCGRPTFDPDKRSRPWLRAVSAGRQVLVCPMCQRDRPDFADGLDSCEHCDAVRLSAMLGEVVCRACGTVQGQLRDPMPPGEADPAGAERGA